MASWRCVNVSYVITPSAHILSVSVSNVCNQGAWPTQQAAAVSKMQDAYENLPLNNMKDETVIQQLIK